MHGPKEKKKYAPAGGDGGQEPRKGFRPVFTHVSCPRRGAGGGLVFAEWISSSFRCRCRSGKRTVGADLCVRPPRAYRFINRTAARLCRLEVRRLPGGGCVRLPHGPEGIGQALSGAEPQEEGVRGGELLGFAETAAGLGGNIVLQKVKVRSVVSFGNCV